ncbi:MAG TPA: hypothetical protein VIM18_10440 [Solirubrobacteraceae bacterium]
MPPRALVCPSNIRFLKLCLSHKSVRSKDGAEQSHGNCWTHPGVCHQADAVAEALGWKFGLSRKRGRAKRFSDIGVG